jgi:hypothetical protein
MAKKAIQRERKRNIGNMLKNVGQRLKKTDFFFVHPQLTTQEI